jgi:hypothetical protein
MQREEHATCLDASRAKLALHSMAAFVPLYVIVIRFYVSYNTSSTNSVADKLWLLTTFDVHLGPIVVIFIHYVQRAPTIQTETPSQLSANHTTVHQLL